MICVSSISWQSPQVHVFVQALTELLHFVLYPGGLSSISIYGAYCFLICDKISKVPSYASTRTYLAAILFHNIELGFSTNSNHMEQSNMLIQPVLEMSKDIHYTAFALGQLYHSSRWISCRSTRMADQCLSLGRWFSHCFEQYIRTPIKVIDSVLGKFWVSGFDQRYWSL